jgi:hypothetical protein
MLALNAPWNVKLYLWQKMPGFKLPQLSAAASACRKHYMTRYQCTINNMLIHRCTLFILHWNNDTMLSYLRTVSRRIECVKCFTYADKAASSTGWVFEFDQLSYTRQIAGSFGVTRSLWTTKALLLRSDFVDFWFSAEAMKCTITWRNNESQQGVEYILSELYRSDLSQHICERNCNLNRLIWRTVQSVSLMHNNIFLRDWGGG